MYGGCKLQSYILMRTHEVIIIIIIYRNIMLIHDSILL
jgi:hypothetical protein